MIQQMWQSTLRACVYSQQNTKYPVFWLAQITLCVMTLHSVLPCLGPNVISDGLTNRLSISKLQYKLNDFCNYLEKK